MLKNLFDPENWHTFWKKQKTALINSAWKTSIKPQDWGYRVNAVDFSFLKKRISRVDTIQAYVSSSLPKLDR